MKPSEIPDEWTQATPDDARTWEANLRQHVVEGHPLHRVSVQCLARRDGSDDLVFALFGHEREFAVVNLTNAATNPTFFRDTAEFLSEWRRIL